MGKVAYCAVLCAFSLALGVAGGVLAQDGKSSRPAKPVPVAPKSARPTPAAASIQTVAMPDADKIVLLLRSTLLTLNDALQTGNYTVLRDSAAPGFRDANTAAKLAHVFAPLAAQGVDLTAVAILAPQLTEVPTIEPQRQMLRLKGYFPGQPQQINFELLYEPVAGRWRLFGVWDAMAQAAPQARLPEPTPDVSKQKAATRKPN